LLVGYEWGVRVIFQIYSALSRVSSDPVLPLVHTAMTK
jgi:hypothetical protein